MKSQTVESRNQIANIETTHKYRREDDIRKSNTKKCLVHDKNKIMQLTEKKSKINFE
jgi:hypothetical protein